MREDHNIHIIIHFKKVSRMGVEFSTFGCKETLEAVQQSVDDELIAYRGLRRICRLAETPENRTKLGSIGVCEAVLTIVKAHSSNHKIISLAFISIANLALENEENRSHLGAVGACEDVVSLLSSTWEVSTSMTFNGCSALQSLLVRNNDNRVKLGQTSCISVVGNIIKAHIQDVDIVSQSILILASMTIGDQNSEQLSSIGIVELVVVLLNSHVEVDLIVQQACLIISRLARRHSSFRNELGTCGACEGVVLAMRQHSRNTDIVQAGCTAIASLAASNPSGQVQVALPTFQVYNPAQPNSPGSPRASKVAPSRRGLSSVPKLDDEVNRERLGRSGACQIIAHVLRAHSSHKKVVLHAFDAICSLILDNESNSSLFGALDVCQEVIWSLKEHISVVEICRLGCSAISSLSLNKNNKLALSFAVEDDTGKMSSAGGCETIVQAMLSHISDEGVASQGCSAIGNLAMLSDEISALLCACGACDTVVTSVKAHPSNLSGKTN